MAVATTDRRALRAAGAATAALLVAVSSAAGPALANPGAPADSQKVHPVGQSPAGNIVKQVTLCAEASVLPDSRFTSIPASSAFGVGQLHAVARGHGQTVAILDSGVQPVARLDHLRGGGDFVAGGDGLTDCDAHGTLTAGIIGAAPSTDDDFVGVAPDAQLISIRIASAAYSEYDAADRRVPTDRAVALAEGIVRAADLGATVIAIPVGYCLPLDSIHAAGPTRVKDALRYAVEDKGALVVAAGGSAFLQGCSNNDESVKPAGSPDRRGWSSVKTASIPSYFAEDVLSVGGITFGGQVYTRGLPGPWIEVAAPATGIVSLAPDSRIRGGLVNAMVTQGNPRALDGTGYAAAYVAGLAALIRETHPRLTARQVRSRIVETAIPAANGLNNATGFGVVNAAAALASDLPISDYAIVAPSASDAPATVAGRSLLAQPVVVAAYAASAMLILAFAGAVGLRTRRTRSTARR